MRLEVDALVEAALADASQPQPTPVAPASEFAKLADALDQAAGQKPAETPAKRERFLKLAMAVILDACEDPKARHGLEVVAQDVAKTAAGAGGALVGAAPSTPGTSTEEVASKTVTIEKQCLAPGRTLFKKLEDGAAPAAAATNG